MAYARRLIGAILVAACLVGARPAAAEDFKIGLTKIANTAPIAIATAAPTMLNRRVLRRRTGKRQRTRRGPAISR